MASRARAPVSRARALSTHRGYFRLWPMGGQGADGLGDHLKRPYPGVVLESLDRRIRVGRSERIVARVEDRGDACVQAGQAGEHRTRIHLLRPVVAARARATRIGVQEFDITDHARGLGLPARRAKLPPVRTTSRYRHATRTARCIRNKTTICRSLPSGLCRPAIPRCPRGAA